MQRSVRVMLAQERKAKGARFFSSTKRRKKARHLVALARREKRRALVSKNRNRYFLLSFFSSTTTTKLTAGRFVEVDIDALELEVRVALVGSCFK